MNVKEWRPCVNVTNLRHKSVVVWSLPEFELRRDVCCDLLLMRAAGNHANDRIRHSNDSFGGRLQGFS